MASEDVKKLLIVVSLFLLVFLTFFFFFWRPKSADLRRYQRDLSNKEAELLRLEEDISYWPESLQETIKQYEDEEEELWNLIPSEEEIAMLLDEIQTRARAANLEILSLSRVSTTSATPEITQPKAGGKPQYVSVPYKISLGGSYFGLIRFLRKLEDSKRLVIVTDVDIYSGRGKHPVDVEIQFNIFYSQSGGGNGLRQPLISLIATN